MISNRMFDHISPWLCEPERHGLTYLALPSSCVCVCAPVFIFPGDASCHLRETFCDAVSRECMQRTIIRTSSRAVLPSQAKVSYKVKLFTWSYGKHHCAWETMGYWLDIAKNCHVWYPCSPPLPRISVLHLLGAPFLHSYFLPRSYLSFKVLDRPSSLISDSWIKIMVSWIIWKMIQIWQPLPSSLPCWHLVLRYAIILVHLTH